MGKTIDFEPFVRQFEALEYLMDDHTNEVLYGGGARGGKSYLGCAWIHIEAISKPRSTWLIARKRFTDLCDTTLITFHKVAKNLGVEDEFTYNGQLKRATYANGSVVFFKDINHEPSDPEYDRLGSYDLTGDFLDEAQEIHPKAVSVLRGRFSNLEGDDWSTIPKSFYPCNPKRNWVYNEFYRPWKEGKLSDDKAFVLSLAADNPYVTKAYIKNLEKADKVTVQRLLHGNFEYDDTKGLLMSHDNVCDIFTNSITKNSNDKYLIVDVAGTEGTDYIKFGYFEGLELMEVVTKKGLSGEGIIDEIRNITSSKQIPYSHVAVDAIGVGDFVAYSKRLNGIIPFKGSNSPFKTTIDIAKPNLPFHHLVSDFINLRAQCGFALSDAVNQHKVASRITGAVKDNIIEELGVYIDVSKEGQKRQLVSKSVDTPIQKCMKTLLGRSPDDSDLLLMRMYFEVRKLIDPDNGVGVDMDDDIFEERVSIV